MEPRKTQQQLLHEWDNGTEHPANRAFRLITELTGFSAPSSADRMSSWQGGRHFVVLTEHLDFAQWLIESLEPLNDYPIDGWILLNHLLLLGADTPLPSTKRLADDPAWIITTKSPYLASLVGFGLLEQCAMLRTNAWDWDGMPTHTIDNPRLLGRTGKRRRYGMTDQIVDLRHKLILLEESLGVTRIQFIDTARRLSAWRTLQPTDPRQDLYDALFEARNLMMHGVRTEGWEGWLVTLLCFIVYADQLMSG